VESRLAESRQDRGGNQKTRRDKKRKMTDYEQFIERKSQLGGEFGFKPTFMPDFLFPFQRSLVEWALRKGRAAVFADCGLGKTVQQLVWAENVFQRGRKPVLLLTPLAVGAQTVAEAKRFGIDAARSGDGKVAAEITVTNYDRLHLFNAEDFCAVAADESSIIKHATGATQKQVTRFMARNKCLPNCYI
jgi:hypothetical protein